MFKIFGVVMSFEQSNIEIINISVIVNVSSDDEINL